MTTIDDRPTITHPAWCWPEWCTAHHEGEHRLGDHLQGVQRFRPQAGGQLEVVLSRDAGDPNGPPYYVTVLRPVDQDFCCEGEDNAVNRRLQGDAPIFLEPEEARMLARFLCNAADKWDDLHGKTLRAEPEVAGEHVWDCPTCDREVVSAWSTPSSCIDCTCPVVEQ